MPRSMETIRGVRPEELDDYNPEAFDARKNEDGTFDLIPVRWMNQSEYNEVQYGCGRDEDDDLEDEARRDGEAYAREERGPGAR